MQDIPFNVPPISGNESALFLEVLENKKLCGDGPFSKRCEKWFENRLGCHKALLTPSCTQALEMAAILIDVRPGDEVIMPSYTFVSTANAFVLRGAKIIFVDIRPDTMNIDETLIEAAITAKTKAIVPVHYAGVSCEMDTIMAIASEYGLYVIEDAAQGVMSKYKERPLGSIGHLAAFSFHETKNYTSGGEGGLLIINDHQFIERAEIIREKGTNRSMFLQGAVDKYSWVDIGSSYLPSELQAAYLWGQLNKADEINNFRLNAWRYYFEAFFTLQQQKVFELPIVPSDCNHNAHMFYLKVKDLKERGALLQYLKEHGVYAAFHYVPLHSSIAGSVHSKFIGEDIFTTKESDRLVRLPLWYGLEEGMLSRITQAVSNFYTQ
jgi:dTDP-4-amino-4,6-dideoxygalactose transaminase